MTGGQGDTKACERRQKAVEHEAAMEAKQAGTSPRREWADDANPLTRRGYRSSMTKGRRSPILPFWGNSAYRVGDPPREPQDPSPPLGPVVGGPPTLLHPMGVQDSATAIDDRIRIG